MKMIDCFDDGFGFLNCDHVSFLNIKIKTFDNFSSGFQEVAKKF